jgi:hypothetical protein
MAIVDGEVCLISISMNALPDRGLGTSVQPHLDYFALYLQNHS